MSSMQPSERTGNFNTALERRLASHQDGDAKLLKSLSAVCRCSGASPRTAATVRHATVLIETCHRQYWRCCRAIRTHPCDGMGDGGESGCD